jgi:hypothetical protein
MTASTWTRNYQNLIAKSSVFLCKVLEKIAINQKMPTSEEISLHYEPLLKFEYKVKILFKYILEAWWGTFKIRAKSRMSKRKGNWSVAYSKFDNFKKSLWRYTEIPNNKHSFFADPFVITYNNSTIMFVEEFDTLAKKGMISAIDITGETPKAIGPVLEESFHLSFPFVFNYEQKVYMIPESSRAHQIRLYESTLFPIKWKLVKVIMDNINAADSMVLKHNNRWFLFTNICSAGLGDFNSELHIYYADSIFSDHWSPIGSGNPVIFDSLRARNAGLIFNDDKIYRINQIHGKNHYGKSIGINRVHDLN